MTRTPAEAAALARRIETAAAELMERTGRQGPAGVEVARIAGGRAVWLGPGSPFSTALGLGLAGEVSEEDLDLVEAHLGRGGAPVRVDLSAPADGSLAAELGARRYAVRDFQQVWVRSPGPADAGAGIRVRPAEPEEEDLWIDLFAEAFLGAMPGGMPGREALRAMTKVDGQAAFLAFEDGMAAGVALASDLDGVALLTGAGVIPAFRGRGLHGELVAARLTWARGRGCDLAVSTTRSGTASQRTLERAGFRCAYPKAVLVGHSGTGRA